MSNRLKTTAVGLGLALLLAACGEHPPMQSAQSGYRGTGMAQIENPRLAAYIDKQAGAFPPAPYELPPDEGERASQIYQNVQVLGGVSAARFNRLMLAITEWVVPAAYRESEEGAGGCNYCHNPANLASDEKYTKVVARRMLQMTINLNTSWTPHVGATGVTCYTCHRGQPVPGAIWTTRANDDDKGAIVANMYGQNNPDEAVAFTSLPYDPFGPYLQNASQIRVQQQERFPVKGETYPTIRNTEQTYGLMMHMSKGLGVNCTFCHNSRAFANWPQSNPQRVTAWHGIRMVQDINAHYIYGLQNVFADGKTQWSSYGPPRLGPLGAPLMANCTTCHRGQNKPLNGASQMAEFPSLALSSTWPELKPLAVAAAAPPPPAPEPPAAPEPARRRRGHR